MKIYMEVLRAQEATWYPAKSSIGAARPNKPSSQVSNIHARNPCQSMKTLKMYENHETMWKSRKIMKIQQNQSNQLKTMKSMSIDQNTYELLKIYEKSMNMFKTLWDSEKLLRSMKIFEIFELRSAKPNLQACQVWASSFRDSDSTRNAF